jgi:hypothetical protein
LTTREQRTNIHVLPVRLAEHFAALVGVLFLLPSAIAAPSKSTAAAPPKGQYTTEADAKATCPADTVVWVNPKSKVFHSSSSKSYGKTKSGAYMCEKEATTSGYRPPKVPVSKKSKTT